MRLVSITAQSQALALRAGEVLLRSSCTFRTTQTLRGVLQVIPPATPADWRRHAGRCTVYCSCALAVHISSSSVGSRRNSGTRYRTAVELPLVVRDRGGGGGGGPWRSAAPRLGAAARRAHVHGDADGAFRAAPAGSQPPRTEPFPPLSQPFAEKKVSETPGSPFASPSAGSALGGGRRPPPPLPPSPSTTPSLPSPGMVRALFFGVVAVGGGQETAGKCVGRERGREKRMGGEGARKGGRERGRGGRRRGGREG